MADRRQLRSSSTSTVPSSPIVNKRPRRASNARNPNDDTQQRERKRALDRKAQRASREKTKSHIAHLEQMVQILSEKNGDAATKELMLEVERLQAEVERLRKIIDGIRSALGPGPEGLDVGGESSTVLRTDARLKSELTKHQEGHVDSKDSVSTSQASALPTDPEQSSNGSTIEESELAEPYDMDIEILPTISETSLARLPGSPETTVSILNWSDSWDEETIVVDTKLPPYHSDRQCPLPSTLTNSIPTPSTPQYLPCELWQKANSIYAKIFQFNQERVAMANEAESGSLVKVVKYGWGSLSLQERANPVFVILKEVDQQLFWDLDPVTKIANLYKSWLLLKYYFNRERHNLEKMPAWQRPVTSQKTNQHPIPIDFFPWPALRDRLVRHHNYYFATSEFSVHYRQHFKFSWPFSFNDTYRYDSATHTYTISPLFERYHRDMRCWSMEQRFFDKFPEFIGEITAYRSDGWKKSGNLGQGHHQKPVDVPEILRRFGRKEGESCGSHDGVGMGSCGGEGCGFSDKDIMELFNEYPELM